MKGYNFQTNYDTKKSLSDSLILKSLPYGKWTTKDNKEYLFNRDYEPIQGWDLNNNLPIPVMKHMWISEIVEDNTIMYYGNKIEYPTKSLDTLRKCWDILAEWSKRESNHIMEV